MNKLIHKSTRMIYIQDIFSALKRRGLLRFTTKIYICHRATIWRTKIFHEFVGATLETPILSINLRFAKLSSKFGRALFNMGFKSNVD